MKKLCLLVLALGLAVGLIAQERYLEIYKDGQVTHAISLADISQMQIGTVLHNNHDYVDLGLPSGTLWATCNVGALLPEASGGMYAWGETVTKTLYTTDNLATNGKDIVDYSGDPTYDVATKLWGGTWRTPTHAEMQELVSECTWVWTTVNGVNGYIITSKSNTNYIFLPAAGYTKTSADVIDGNTLGRYWTSTQYDGSIKETNDVNRAHAFYLSFQSGNSINADTYYNRYCGRSVRAVMTGSKPSSETFSFMSLALPASDAEEHVWLADMAAITFPNNHQLSIAFNNGSADYTYETSGLGVITFESTDLSSEDQGPATEVASVTSQDIRLHHDGEQLCVESTSLIETLRIFNMQGQLLYQVAPISKHVTLSTMDMPVGVLCVQLMTTETIETYKIIKP